MSLLAAGALVCGWTMQADGEHLEDWKGRHLRAVRKSAMIWPRHQLFPAAWCYLPLSLSLSLSLSVFLSNLFLSLFSFSSQSLPPLFCHIQSR